MPTMTTTTGWPPKVVARYANLTGATVDVEDDTREVRVICRGCPAFTSRWTLRSEGITGYALLDALTQAQDRAQTHAAACRALPHPDGA